jgi:hypothetical protein
MLTENPTCESFDRTASCGFPPEKQREYLRETKEILLPCFQRFLSGNDPASLAIPARNIYRELVEEIRSIEKSPC